MTLSLPSIKSKTQFNISAVVPKPRNSKMFWKWAKRVELAGLVESVELRGFVRFYYFQLVQHFFNIYIELMKSSQN